jgi:hypothetical protein
MSNPNTTTTPAATAATSPTPASPPAKTPSATAGPSAGAPATPATPRFAPITQAQIDSFADKLAKSGTGLAPSEQSLLGMIVAQARAITPHDVQVQQLQIGFTEALQSVVVAQQAAWASGSDSDPGTGGGPGWAKIEPIWYKAGDETSGSIEMSVSVAEAETAVAGPVAGAAAGGAGITGTQSP